MVDGRATERPRGSQHAAQKAARWCRWEENSQHVIIMPANHRRRSVCLGTAFVMLHLITLRHLYHMVHALLDCRYTGAFQRSMRHVHDRHGVRRYNFHLGWTDVRRRERTASGPSFLWTRVRSHPFTHTLPMQHRMEPSTMDV